MLSELLLILLMVVLLTQNSSLVSALVIVPSSLAIIMMVSSPNEFSGLLMVLFVMVFVGGLMVLLMSLTSLAPQELPFWVTYFTLLPFLLSIPFLLEPKSVKESALTTSLFEWVASEGHLMNMMSLTLVLALVCLSYFLQLFKGLMRSL